MLGVTEMGRNDDPVVEATEPARSRPEWLQERLGWKAAKDMAATETLAPVGADPGLECGANILSSRLILRTYSLQRSF